MRFKPSQNLSDMVSIEDYGDKLCTGMNPGIFFPPSEEQIREMGDNVIEFPGMTERAQEICGRCICSWVCFLAADLRGAEEGIFGGVDFSQL